MGEEPNLKVVYSPRALSQLEQIRAWNQEFYSAEHARSYIEFLLDKIDELEFSTASAAVVPNRPELQYLILKRRLHGHVVVFRNIASRLDVLGIFHTAEHWQEKIDE